MIRPQLGILWINKKSHTKLRDTAYVMFDDVFQGAGENLTQIAHEKGIDACYKKVGKVSFVLSSNMFAQKCLKSVNLYRSKF